MGDIFLMGELFEQVQMQNIFPDGKTFVDCTPRSNLSAIQQKFKEQKDEEGFDLALFVHENFLLPKTYSTTNEKANMPIAAHIESLWNDLTRQPEK